MRIGFRGALGLVVFAAMGCHRDGAPPDRAAPRLARSAHPPEHPTLSAPGTAPFGSAEGEQELVTVGASSVTRAALGIGLGQAPSQQLTGNSLSGNYVLALDDGYLYAWSGQDSSTGNASNAVMSMALSGGTANGTWVDANTSTTDLFSPRQLAGGAIYEGYLYVVGGYLASGNPTADVSFAPLVGSGLVGSWQSTTPLPFGVGYTSAVAYQGYLYVAGGIDQSGSAQAIYQAPLNADGTVGGWIAVGATPISRAYAGAAAFNGFLYVSGGNDQNGAGQDNVAYIAVGDGGATGAWESSGAWPNFTGGTVSAISGGTLYVNNSNLGYNFNFAQLLENGDLGAWMIAPNFGSSDNNAFFSDSANLYNVNSGATRLDLAPLTFTVSPQAEVNGAPPPRNLVAPAVFTYRNTVYVVGGYDTNAQGEVTDILEGPLSPNGEVGQWALDPVALPVALQGHAATIHDGYLWVAGGCSDDCGTFSSAVRRAAIDPGSGTIVDGGSETWVTQAAWNLSPARSYLASAVWADAWYILGGENSSDVEVSTVQVAGFQPGGNLSTWSATASLPQAASNNAQIGANFAAVASEGYLYTVAGQSTTPLHVASLLSNGDLGGWSQVQSATIQTGFTSLVTWNGDLMALQGGSMNTAPIAIGGVPVGFTNSTYAGGIHGGNQDTGVISNGNVVVFDTNGDSVGSNTLSLEGLPIAQQEVSTLDVSARSGHAMAYANGYAYLAGGQVANGVATDGGIAEAYLADVQFVPLTSAGSPPGLITWSQTSSLPVARAGLGLVASGGYLYAVGGVSSAGYSTEIDSAPINGDGSVGTFTAVGTLPQATAFAWVGAYRGNLYVVGGTNGAELSTVELAPLGAQGAIGGWTTGTALPAPRSHLAGAAHAGYLFVLGGLSNGAVLDSVLVSTLSSSGASGAWKPTASLNDPRCDAVGFAMQGRLYALGGSNGTVDLGDLVMAPISGNGGQLGGWYDTAVALSPPLSGLAAAVTDTGFLVWSGGRSSGVDQDNSQSFSFQLTPARGRYSQLFDLGAPGIVNSISLGGTASLPGTLDLFYSLAPELAADGGSPPFGPETAAGAVSPGAMVNVGATNIRYVRVRAVLDDSDEVVVGPPAGGASGDTLVRDLTAISITINAPSSSVSSSSSSTAATSSSSSSSSSGSFGGSSSTSSLAATSSSGSSGSLGASSSAGASSSTATSSSSSTTSMSSSSSSGAASGSSSGGSSSGAGMGSSSGASCTTSIVEDANPSAIVGTNYLYNALGAIDVTGTTPAGITYSACGTASSVPGFVVFPTTGVVTWVPTAAGATPLCVQINYGGTCAATYAFTVTVVTSADAGPTASLTATPQSIQVGQSVAFDGSASTPGTGATLVDYLWDFGDGTSIDPLTLSQSTTSHTYQQPGGYVGRLTVINSLGEQATSAGVPIAVGDAQCQNPPTVQIVAHQLTGNVGFSETFSETGTSGLNFLWDFGNGTESSSAMPTFTFSKAGLYHIRLTGIDPTTGCTAQDAVQISVSNGTEQPPTCQFVADPSSGSLDASGQLAVTFRALCFEAPATGSTTAPVLTYLWTFDDDGTTSSQAMVTHTYTSAGSFSPQITVTDPNGLTNENTLAETVLNSSGVAAPQILSSPATSATCGTPYLYNSLDGNKLLVRAPAAITYSTGKMVAGATVGAPAGLSVSSDGTVAWTPTVAEAGAQPVVLVATDPGGAAVQQFTVQVACTATGTDGGTCDGGTCSAPAKGCGCTTGDAGPGGLLILLAWARLGRRRRAR